MMSRISQILVAIYVLALACDAWVAPAVPICRRETSLQATASLKIVGSARDDLSISRAGEFLVDSFWLGSPRQLLQRQEEPIAIQDSIRQHAVREQNLDLMEKYGERMGSRLLESSLLVAKDGESEDILGLVALEVLVLDEKKQDVLSAEESEAILKNAVASLSPPKRRQYKNSSAKQIASQLLPAEMKAVCFLSYLTVLPSERRKGIAAKLCDETERLAKEWQYDSIFLKVEDDNVAARELYEQKIGYELQYTIESATALRLDLEAGSFVEIEKDTLVFVKHLSKKGAI